MKRFIEESAIINQMLKESGISLKKLKKSFVTRDEFLRKNGMDRKFYDKEFDIKVNIEVKVMKRTYYENLGEEIAWEGIENSVNIEAKILGMSLEDYFRNITDRLVKEKL